MKKKLQFVLIASFTFLSGLNAQSSLKFYQVKLKADEITGLNSFITNKDASSYVDILDNNEKWILRDTTDYTDVIGAYTDNRKSYIPRPLFNISTYTKQYPFLDQIDMEYYESVGMDIFKKRFPVVYASEIFQKFYAEFGKAKTSSEKKIILLNPEYESFRRNLVDTRLTFLPSTSFSLTQEQQSKYTIKLKADLKYEISKINANVGAKLDTYVDKLVDNATIIKGKFLKVGFDSNYTSFLDTYISTADPKRLKRDFFVTQLDKYISDNYARLITQIGVLSFKAKYDKSVINSSKIVAELKNDFKLTPDIANKISAEITATFEKKTEINLNADFTGAFIIGIITDKMLDQLNFKESVKTKLLIKGIE